MAKKIQLTKNSEDVYPVTIPDAIAGLAEVAKTGNYNDLLNRPEGSNIFVVTPEVTLFADINAAYAAGKMIILLDDGYIYTLEQAYSGDGFYFTSVNGDEKRVKYWNVANGDSWDSGSFLLEDSGVFLATYGTTTITQIKDAYDSGKLVVCRKLLGGSDFEYAYLSTIGSTYATFITVLNFDYYFSTYFVNNSGWSMSTDELTIPTALSQLDDDSTHRLVTDTEKTAWNGKTELFVATQGTTTVAEIKSALDAGKVLIAKDTSSRDYYVFSGYTESKTMGVTLKSAWFSRASSISSGTISSMEFRTIGSGNTTCTLTSRPLADLSGSLLQRFSVSELKFPAQSPVPTTNPQTASLGYSIDNKSLQLEIPSGSTYVEEKTLAFVEDISSISLIPDYDEATPIQTIEYDVSYASWRKLFGLSNPSGTKASDKVGTLAFRITTTGSDMSEPQVVDMLVSFYGTEAAHYDTFMNARTADASA